MIYKNVYVETELGRKFYNLYIYREIVTYPHDCGDGIHISGNSYKDVLIRDCIVDFSKYKNKKFIDENMSFVDGTRVDVVNCIIQNGIKGMLIGSGDFYDLDKNNYINLYECIIDNVGRRSPEIQDGGTLSINRCLISNWGSPEWFDTRSFGVYAHNNSTVYCSNTIFSNRFHIHNLASDIANHIGNTFNGDKDPEPLSFKFIKNGIKNLITHPIHALLPGVCRGITLDDSSKCYIDNCYSPWWIRLEGIQNNSMNKDYHDNLINYLDNMKLRLFKLFKLI